MRKIVLVLASVLLLTSVASAGIGCSDDDTIKWRLITYNMPGETRTDILQGFADRVKDLSDGKLEITVFPGEELYQGSAMFDAVSAGNVEICSCPQTYYYNKMPKLVAITSQLWGKDVEERVRYYNAVIKDFDPIVQESVDKDSMVLMWLSTGWLEFYFDTPVKVKEDLVGLHLAAFGEGQGSGIIEALGATPTMTDMSGVYMDAEQGIFDGIPLMPFEDYYNNQFYNVLPHVTITKALDMPYPTLINRSAYEDLDEDLQQIIMEAAAEAQDEAFTSYTAQFESDIADLVDNSKADVYFLPEAERARWINEAFIPVFQYVLGLSFTEAEIAEMNEIVDQIAADIAAES